jgi:hypothetical protein
MSTIRSIDLHQLILTKRIGMGRTLAVLIAIGLALTIISSGEVAAVVRGSIIAYFDQRIALDGEHVLVIHNGTSPTCAVIPNPHSTIASDQIRSGVSSPWTI